MTRRFQWLGPALLTAANVGLLLLIYLGLVMPLTAVPPRPVTDMTLGPTPTPIVTVQVVIALQNLPRGYKFPTTISELEAQNVVVYYTLVEDVVPFNALRRYEGGMEFLLGKVARTDIYREQPILSNMLASDLGELSSTGSDLAAIMPADLVATTLWLPRQALPMGLTTGDHVDVYYTRTEGDAAITARLVSDALVLWLGDLPPGWRMAPEPTPTPVYDSNRAPTPMPAPMNADPILVTLGLRPQDAAEVIWAEHNRMPVVLALRAASAPDSGYVPVMPVSPDSPPK